MFEDSYLDSYYEDANDIQDYDDGQPSELQENEDFAHDNDYDRNEELERE